MKKYKIFVVFILVLGFFLRLYHLDFPILDWHSWRQADTASVTREYVKHGINILVPKYHDLSNIPSGMDNLEGYRMVEFPIINALEAFVIKSFGFDLVVTCRLFSIFASVLSIFLLIKIVYLVEEEKTISLVVGFFYAVLPFAVYYGRVILPEPFMILFYLLALYFFLRYILDSKLYFLYLSSFFQIFAILLKPYTVFLFPIYLYVLYKKYKFKFLKNIHIYNYALISIIPFIAWRSWIQNFKQGIPGSKWLFNEGGYRLKPVWFRWLFFERIFKLISGYFGIIFFIFSFKKTKSKFFIYPFWWIGILIYFIVIARGNIQHDYYQNLAIPVLAYGYGRGAYFFYKFLSKKIEKTLSFVLTAFIAVSSLFISYNGCTCAFDKKIEYLSGKYAFLKNFKFSFYGIKGYFYINRPEFKKAGDWVDKNLPPDALVIAPAFGDTAFLFQTNRKGWPIGFEIDKKIKLGAQYYVSCDLDDDEVKKLSLRYKVLEKNKDFIVIDLTQPLKEK